MRRPGPRLGAPKTRNFILAFLDDVRNLRANAIMIVGVLSFACLVWFHSDRVFDERGAAARAVPAPRGSAAAGKPRDEAVDIGQAMTAILSNHEGVSQAASVAKQAVRREHQLRSAYKASAIFVIKQPGTNLHLAMRNAAKQGFIREIVVLHDMSQPTDAFGRAVGAWTDPPRDIYGKPVKYVRGTKVGLNRCQGCVNGRWFSASKHCSEDTADARQCPHCQSFMATVFFRVGCSCEKDTDPVTDEDMSD